MKRSQRAGIPLASNRPSEHCYSRVLLTRPAACDAVSFKLLKG